MAEIGAFIQEWSDLRTPLSPGSVSITDGAYLRGASLLTDKREEDLSSHHRPQFNAWCAGANTVLCILLSDP